MGPTQLKISLRSTLEHPLWLDTQIVEFQTTNSFFTVEKEKRLKQRISYEFTAQTDRFLGGPSDTVTTPGLKF